MERRRAAAPIGNKVLYNGEIFRERERERLSCYQHGAVFDSCVWQLFGWLAWDFSYEWATREIHVASSKEERTSSGRTTFLLPLTSPSSPPPLLRIPTYYRTTHAKELMTGSAVYTDLLRTRDPVSHSVSPSVDPSETVSFFSPKGDLISITAPAQRTVTSLAFK